MGKIQFIPQVKKFAKLSCSQSLEMVLIELKTIVYAAAFTKMNQ